MSSAIQAWGGISYEALATDSRLNAMEEELLSLEKPKPYLVTESGCILLSKDLYIKGNVYAHSVFKGYNPVYEETFVIRDQVLIQKVNDSNSMVIQDRDLIVDGSIYLCGEAHYGYDTSQLLNGECTCPDAEIEFINTEDGRGLIVAGDLIANTRNLYVRGSVIMGFPKNDIPYAGVRLSTDGKLVVPSDMFVTNDVVAESIYKGYESLEVFADDPCSNGCSCETGLSESTGYNGNLVLSPNDIVVRGDLFIGRNAQIGYNLQSLRPTGNLGTLEHTLNSNINGRAAYAVRNSSIAAPRFFVTGSVYIGFDTEAFPYPGAIPFSFLVGSRNVIDGGIKPRHLDLSEPDGYLGIGTRQPEQQLHVVGGVEATGYYREGTNLDDIYALKTDIIVPEPAQDLTNLKAEWLTSGVVDPDRIANLSIVDAKIVNVAASKVVGLDMYALKTDIIAPDLTNLSATWLTSGNLNPDRIADLSISNQKISNVSSTKVMGLENYALKTDIPPPQDLTHLSADWLTSGTLNMDRIADVSITDSKIENVSAAKVIGLQSYLTDIQAEWITSGTLNPNRLGDSSISDIKIQALSSSKLAGYIDPQLIQDLSLSNTKISSLDSSKLTGTLDVQRIANASLSDVKISDLGAEKLTGTLDVQRIANASLSDVKISDLGAEKLTGTLDVQRIANASLSDVKISDLGAGKLTGTLDVQRIANASLSDVKISDLNYNKLFNTPLPLYEPRQYIVDEDGTVRVPRSLNLTGNLIVQGSVLKGYTTGRTDAEFYNKSLPAKVYRVAGDVTDRTLLVEGDLKIDGSLYTQGLASYGPDTYLYIPGEDGVFYDDGQSNYGANTLIVRGNLYVQDDVFIGSSTAVTAEPTYTRLVLGSNNISTGSVKARHLDLTEPVSVAAPLYATQLYENGVPIDLKYAPINETSVIDPGRIPAITSNMFQSTTGSGAVVLQTSPTIVNPTIYGDLNASQSNVIVKNLSILGNYTTLHTNVQVTDQFTINNAGTGPALVVSQSGTEAVAQFIDSESGTALFISDGGLVGVKTTTPQCALDVSGTIRGTLLQGDGSGISNIAPTSISGTLSASQIPGLDSSKVVSGTLNASRIPALDASILTSGLLNTAVIPLLDATKISSGTFTAAQIPVLDASKVTTGTFSTTRIPSLDAGKITTGTFTTSQIPNLDANKITTGTFGSSQIPSLDAGKITSGVFSTGQIPSLDASKISTGTFTAAQIPSLDASKLTTGLVPVSRGGTGVGTLTGYVLANGINPFTASSTIPANVIVGTVSSAQTSVSCTNANVAAQCPYVYIQSAPLGTNEIKAGTGDGANLTSYNLAIRSWQGIGFPSYDGGNRITVNTRSGDVISAGSYRLRQATYSSMFYNDNNQTYILLTGANDPDGGSNGLRPFYINNVTGDTTLGYGAFFVQHLGNVGIGTGSPSQKLHVTNGGILADCTVDGSPTATISAINYSPGANAFTYIRLGTDTGSSYIFKNSSNRTVDGGAHTLTVRNDDGNARFQAAGGVGITVLGTSGYCGFGTDTPTQRVDIVGTCRATSFSGDGSLLTNLPNTSVPSGWTYSSNTSIIQATDSNALVGIGTLTPGASLEIADTKNNPFLITEYQNATDGAVLRLKKARGTPSAPTAVLASDVLGAIRTFGHNGSSMSPVTAKLDFVAETIFTTSSLPTCFIFYTAPVGGTATSERMRLTSGGNLGIGTSTPAQKLDVAGNINSSGVVSATSFTGSGAALTSLNASNLSTGTVANSLLPTTISVSNLVGNGSGLSALNASNLSTGTINNSLLPTTISLTSLVANSSILVKSTGYLDLGYQDATREVNAGKIGYKFSSTGLDIIGAGNAAGSRLVTIFDNQNVTGNLTANNITVTNTLTAKTGTFLNLNGSGSGLSNLNASNLSSGSISSSLLPGNVSFTNISLSSTGVLDLGLNDPTRESSAGKIGYKKLSTTGLDIVGAGDSIPNRRVHIYDNLTVDQSCTVQYNLSVQNQITCGSLIDNSQIISQNTISIVPGNTNWTNILPVNFTSNNQLIGRFTLTMFFYDGTGLCALASIDYNGIAAAGGPYYYFTSNPVSDNGTRFTSSAPSPSYPVSVQLSSSPGTQFQVGVKYDASSYNSGSSMCKYYFEKVRAFA